jgi:hypothetical protein
MAEFLGYMFFSLVEGLAVFAFMFYIFRFDLFKYILPVIVVISVINLQSYFIREELTLLSISPVINLILTILFLAVYLRIPIIWSMLMTITGYIAFGVLQNIIVFISFGYLSIQEVQSSIWKGYLLQAFSGFIGFAIGWILYKRGLGFAFEFERLRYSWERISLIVVNLTFLVVLFIMMSFKSVFTNLLVLAFALFAFLIYSLKREVNER